MAIDRTKNTKRNIIWGWLNKLLKILCPFLTRTVIIYGLGEEYLGLNSLFTSVLGMLSVAEMGFDSAVVFIMYKGVAEQNKRSLSALLGFIKKAYLAVGTFVLAAGLIMLPFIEYIIEEPESVPADVNVYVVYIVFLLNSVISYYFGGYRNSIIEAHHRQDVISNINSGILMVSSLAQLIVLLLSKSYYLYIVLMPVTTLITNLVVVYYSKKMFPDIMPEGKLEDAERKKLSELVHGTFLSKIGSTLSLQFDNIVASKFLGLVVLAYYSNYTLIITSVKGFLIVIYQSMQAGFGNSVITETKEKNYHNLQKFTFMFDWIVGWCFVCFLFLFQPFIQLWVGEQRLLHTGVLVLLCLNFYIEFCDSILGTYKNAVGIWKEDRYRSLIGGIVNLIFNIAFVMAWREYGDAYGLMGIVLSTIISQLVVLKPWSIAITFKLYFGEGMKKYVLNSLKYFCVTVINVLICSPIIRLFSYENGMNGYVVLVARAIICIVLPNIIYYFFYRKNEYFVDAKEFVMKKVMKKA